MILSTIQEELMLDQKLSSGLRWERGQVGGKGEGAGGRSAVAHQVLYSICYCHTTAVYECHQLLTSHVVRNTLLACQGTIRPMSVLTTC